MLESVIAQMGGKVDGYCTRVVLLVTRLEGKGRGKGVFRFVNNMCESVGLVLESEPWMVTVVLLRTRGERDQVWTRTVCVWV